MKSLWLLAVGPVAAHYTATTYLKVEEAVSSKIYQVQVASMAKLGFQPRTDGLSNDELIDRAAAKYGVPKAIARGVAHTESRLNPIAYSIKGAIGIMQIMPANAKRCELAHAGKLWDEAKNIDCGNRILSEEYKVYGDWPKALKAYNGGPKCVKGTCKESEQYAKDVLKFAKF